MKRFILGVIIVILASCGSKTVKKDLHKMDIKENRELKEKKTVVNIYFDKKYQSPQKVNTFITKGGKKMLFSVEYDFNQDRMVDITILYDDKGVVKKTYSDLDFDKKPDVIDFYKDGKMIRREFKSHIKDLIYIKKYYNDGKLIKKEIDSNFNGKINIIYRYKDGVLYEKSLDINQDGVFDKVIKIKKKKVKDKNESDTK